VYPVSGSYYDGPGGSTSTCHISPCNYASCPIGQKLSGCTAGSPGACVVCLNSIPSGQKYTTNAPSEAGVCGTGVCTTCATGSYKTGCGVGPGTNDGGCTSCGSPPTGKYWIPNVDATSVCTSAFHDVCPAGQYNLGWSNVAKGVCTGCSGLTAKYYWTTPVLASENCNQLAKIKCSDGSKSSLVAADSNILPGICSLCTPLTNNGNYYAANVDYLSNCPTSAFCWCMRFWAVHQRLRYCFSVYESRDMFSMHQRHYQFTGIQ
jgi:hypothetical protein